METPLCIALAILALTSLGSLAAVCYILKMWPHDRSQMQLLVSVYNKGRSDGIEIGEKIGTVAERERLGSWNVDVPMQQRTKVTDDGDAPVEYEDGKVTVGKWKRGPGMPMPQE